MHQKCLSPSTSGWKCKSSLIQHKRSNTQLTVNDIRSDLDLSQMKAECTIKHTVLNDLFYFLVNKYITSLLDFFFFFFKTVKQFPNCFPVKAPFNICTITRHPLLKCNKKKKKKNFTFNRDIHTHKTPNIRGDLFFQIHFCTLLLTNIPAFYSLFSLSYCWHGVWGGQTRMLCRRPMSLFNQWPQQVLGWWQLACMVPKVVNVAQWKSVALCNKKQVWSTPLPYYQILAFF